uniref:Fungal-type protein kinase domain-containing protein n=1 Tax=Moniliophthora roreri TaxID=221103 RepID=A0A0W0GDN9_MONRR
MPTNSAVASANATAPSGTAEYATQIKELVGKLGITGDCKAILTDGDMAAKWETYFDETHNWRTRSGTPEFMSFYLQTAMERSDDQYLQSPVDDLHSFFWVTLWAVMFNGLNCTRSTTEKFWQGNLVGSAASKLSVPHELRPSTGNSPITEQMKPLLRDWYNAMQGLNDDWSVVSRLPDGIEAREWYLPHFHHFAFRGVVETLELMLKHHSTLLKYPPFPST